MSHPSSCSSYVFTLIYTNLPDQGVDDEGLCRRDIAFHILGRFAFSYQVDASLILFMIRSESTCLFFNLSDNLPFSYLLFIPEKSTCFGSQELDPLD